MSLGESISFCLTGLCVIIYVPVILNALRQIQNGEVILTGITPMNPFPKRYTGASATTYAVAQAISALVLIGSTMLAFTQNNIIIIVVGIILSLIIAWGGLRLADQMGYERIQPTSAQAMSFLTQFFSNATGGISFMQSDEDVVVVNKNDEEPVIIIDDTARTPSRKLPGEDDIEDAVFTDVDPDDEPTASS